jgi:hypothetical protein
MVKRVTLIRLTAILASTAAYVVLFRLFQEWGFVSGYFVLIPLVTCSLLYGKKVGLSIGVISHPVNLLVGMSLGRQISSASFSPAKLAAWFIALCLGILLGALRDANRRYRNANKELQQALAMSFNKGVRTEQSLCQFAGVVC